MSTVQKSSRTDDPIIQYCARLTNKLLTVEKELQEASLKSPMGRMVGAPEVLQLGKNFLQLIGAKRALDVGTFTGASAFAWASVLPEDGEVVSMDVDHSNLDNIGKPIIGKVPEVVKKIKFELGPAVETLDSLIKNGQSGKFDFAFIDADKGNYSAYYKKCMELLKPGGVILVDNSLWGGSVVTAPTGTEDTKAIVACNELISNDPASNSALLNVGDGLHIAFKK